MTTWTDGQVFGLILVGMGSVAFLVILEWRRRTFRMGKSGVPAVATVGNVKYRKGEAGSFYRAELSFVDKHDEVVKTKVSVGSAQPKGARINIIYDPDSPTRVMLASHVGRWNPDDGLLAFGGWWTPVLILLVPGIVLILIPVGPQI